MSESAHKTPDLESWRARSRLCRHGRPARRPVPFDLVAMAVSAGGLQALTTVLSSLPDDFPAPVVIVQHLGRSCASMLAPILDSRGPLPVEEAVQGRVLRGGVVYVAPFDQHLRVTPRGTVSLSREARVHFTRPAADPLLESVAAVFGPRAISVVLTGRGQDGAAGTAAIKQGGGVTIAQHPDSCYCASMPRAAIRTGCVDFVLSLPAIAPALVSLVMVRGAARLFGIAPSAPAPGPEPLLPLPT